MPRYLPLLALVSGVTASIKIKGLTLPTGFAWNDNKQVYITEKNGIVMKADSFNASTAFPILDISAQVATFGDHGLTSVEVYNNSLYVTYMTYNPGVFANCSDDGTVNGRDNAQVKGCPVHGRLSKWNLDSNGNITGSEIILIDGTRTLCAQFSVAGSDYVATGPDGNLYVSVGYGADEFAVDYGQFGGDPCGVRDPWGGPFRTQSTNSLAGKVFQYDPVSKAVTIVAKGFHNPWRFAFGPAGLYIGDTALNQWEEINGPISLSSITGTQQPVNYGFPCYEGNGQLAQYAALGSDVCSFMPRDPLLTYPLYTYRANSSEEHTVVSAVAFAAAYNRILYGDYMQGKIFSINAQGADLHTELTGVYPVEISFVPGIGMVYADIVFGQIRSLDSYGPETGSIPSTSAASSASLGFATTIAVAAVTGLAAYAGRH